MKGVWSSNDARKALPLFLDNFGGRVSYILRSVPASTCHAAKSRTFGTKSSCL